MYHFYILLYKRALSLRFLLHVLQGEAASLRALQVNNMSMNPPR